MSANRVVLVEYLDAAGSASRDARERAAALQRAGAQVLAAVVDSAHNAELHPSPPVPSISHFHDDASGRRALEAMVAEASPDRIVIASAAPGGGAVGEWFDRHASVHWWPTAVGDARARGSHRGLFGDDPASALETTPLEHARLGKGQLPLWDGDYVLALTPLTEGPGEAVIDAFARLCEDSDGIDLVVLANPQRVFERYARARGVGFRVHFAGVAPRDAETAWLSAAAAAVIGGEGPLSAGAVLRSLARGCPILAPLESAMGRTLETWLARNACAVPVGATFSGRLSNAVARMGVDDALARGRSIAEAARPEALAGRLATALGMPAQKRRAA